jgi:hypothetical protein
MGITPPVPPEELGALLSALDHGTAVQTLLAPSSKGAGSLAFASVAGLVLRAVGETAAGPPAD